ncbi:MAG: alanine racemase [Gemmatimonadetes bacterium]|nr:MAG: alanine racemase [Gemmatimonadota bacterium]
MIPQESPVSNVPAAETRNVTASHRAWIEVDLGAVVRNARALIACARKPLLPMVKADAYGLGLLPIVRALEPLDLWGYGVATVIEGEQLRASGIQRPILITSPTTPTEFGRIIASRLTPSHGDAATIAGWVAAGGTDWHLAIDTGMHRAGVRWDEIASIIGAVQMSPPTGAHTHFHSSELDNGTMQQQTQRFREAVAALPAAPALLHTENSGAIVRTSPSPWSFVRPGVFLYGVGSGAKLQPDPVAQFFAQIVDIHDLNAGDSVSYDATWTATKPTRVATLSVGYADGYRRSLGNVGNVLIGGRRAKIVGTVTMDMTMVDVTDIPCARGDLATMIGKDGNEQITAEDVATACGLSPYEILTGLNARAPRVYR